MLVDAHSHPTESPEWLGNLAALPARVVIMSTRDDDLRLVDESAVYPQVTPSFGLHPWWSYKAYTSTSNKAEHYKQVLDPEPTDEVIARLPEPFSLENHLSRIESYLLAHPDALVGELGLDKGFRVAIDGKLSAYHVKIDHQIVVLKRQLRLAEKYQRRVSLHGVQAHMALFDAVKSFRLPAICLHAYSGSVDFLKNRWLRLESPVYITVGMLVNITTQARADKLLKGTPQDRVLTESDYNKAGNEMLRLLNEAVDRVAAAYEWDRETTKSMMEKNLAAFLGVEGFDPLPPLTSMMED